MGNVQLILHAHLPFIRHPEHETFLEETWLFEAISESYIPLLRMLNRLDADGIPARITMSFSPSLTAMLQDELLQARYIEHLNKLVELGEKEVERNRNDDNFAPLSEMYLQLYRSNLDLFTGDLQHDILSGFDYHQKKGNIEIITSPGTYPFLPFYEQYPANIHAHLEAALDSHRKVFSRASNGIWLPECGYFPGLEELLREHGINYFFLEAHGILFADNCPKSGTYAPVQTPAGLFAFARDVASVNRVWSETDGYPGEISYRDFYRDIGHDLEFDYIKPYIHLEEFRVNTGYKYYAITGNTQEKQVYRPREAAKKVAEHADNFLYSIRERMEKITPLMTREPVITTPFSAELFGHWWFEGVDWLEAVLNGMAGAPWPLSIANPAAYSSSKSSQGIS
jgi:1,4-alpha-glucan branching enzyme